MIKKKATEIINRWRNVRLSKTGQKLVAVVFVSLLFVGVFIIIKQSTQKVYSAQDFGYVVLKSEMDFNQNGIDDYKDFLIGAQKDAQKKPVYDDRYVNDNLGYPDEDKGVCTDVIWRAFREAGYSLRDMVDADIRANLPVYARVVETRDPYIDFRRVGVLKIFFDRFAEKLSVIATNDPGQFQAGDIVIYGSDFHHIGIVSDKRNEQGIPYLIHNAGQDKREEDALLKFGAITAHYRFNARLISEDKLLEFQEPETQGHNPND